MTILAALLTFDEFMMIGMLVYMFGAGWWIAKNDEPGRPPLG